MIILTTFFRSPSFCQLCVRVFDRQSVHTIKFDDFIQCCVMLKTLTEKFREKDTAQQGSIRIHYEEVMFAYFILPILRQNYVHLH